MFVLLLALYFTVLGFLSILGVYRLALAAVALFCRPRGASDGGFLAPTSSEVPDVVIQLPLYNERFVAERLLRAAAAIRYPRDRLHIQVLDDSTDATRSVVNRVALELSEQGIPIEVVRRTVRSGFKAGALRHGMSLSKAELIAIFDADFVPRADFLERTVPLLMADPRCGLVQARWGHINRDASWLTRAQAVYLDGHFAVEHQARQALGHFFNFNGTAGLWRRAAIVDGGGWSEDTITEDLDLSYRAQVRGWRFRYAHGVVAPAELPSSWAAFRTQQRRWVRGSIETARKHLASLIGNRRLAPAVRLDAAIHLTNNVAYFLMACLAVLLPASVWLRYELGWRVPGGEALLSTFDISLLFGGTLATVVFYAVALVRTDGALRLGRLLDILFALSLGAGMSLSNAREVLRGLRSESSEFLRTPKFGDGAKTAALQAYRPRLAVRNVAAELLFVLYFSVAIAFAIESMLFGALPFLLLYWVGFVAVVGGHMVEGYEKRVLSKERSETRSQTA